MREMFAHRRIARSVVIEPARQPRVELTPPLLRNQPVGGFLQQRMPELLPARSARLDQLALREAIDVDQDGPAYQRLDRRDGEVSPGHRGDTRQLRAPGRAAPPGAR